MSSLLEMCPGITDLRYHAWSRCLEVSFRHEPPREPSNLFALANAMDLKCNDLIVYNKAGLGRACYRRVNSTWTNVWQFPLEEPE